MAIGIVWFFLGLLWWGAILAGAWGVYATYPRGRRAAPVAVYFAGIGTVVGSTALIPTVGTWVWFPIYFVLLAPLAALKSCLGG